MECHSLHFWTFMLSCSCLCLSFVFALHVMLEVECRPPCCVFNCGHPTYHIEFQHRHMAVVQLAQLQNMQVHGTSHTYIQSLPLLYLAPVNLSTWHDYVLYRPFFRWWCLSCVGWINSDEYLHGWSIMPSPYLCYYALSRQCDTQPVIAQCLVGIACSPWT